MPSTKSTFVYYWMLVSVFTGLNNFTNKNISFLFYNLFILVLNVYIVIFCFVLYLSSYVYCVQFLWDLLVLKNLLCAYNFVYILQRLHDTLFQLSQYFDVSYRNNFLLHKTFAYNYVFRMIHILCVWLIVKLLKIYNDHTIIIIYFIIWYVCFI